MGGFLVDLDALSDAANGIQATMDEMATLRVSDLTLSGDDLGNDQVTQAYGDFVVRWDLGVVNLEKDGDTIIVGLQRCASVYRGTDEAAAQDFRGVISRAAGPDPGMG
ncbi:MAG: hypothetical protein FWD63_01640 [Propionibacteriaceae bacterium]|nr:hypothetical protein [Propionibacteriaceae bacterium]